MTPSVDISRKGKGKPVDAEGTYITRNGDAVKFRGVEELANYLVNSDETHTAFVEQLFHYLVKQPIRAYGPETSAKLQQSLAANHFNFARN